MKKYVSYFQPLFIFVMICSMIYLGCESSVEPDKNTPGEQELITTLKLTLVDNQNNTTTATWKDLDGANPNPPVVDTLVLESGMNYKGSIELLDESKNPVENLTKEIESKKESHMFVYNIQKTNQVTVTITDKDAKNLDVGLKFDVVVQANSAGEGTWNVILYHYSGNLVKDGKTTGETDVDAKIPLKILPAK